MVENIITAKAPLCVQLLTIYQGRVTLRFEKSCGKAQRASSCCSCLWASVLVPVVHVNTETFICSAFRVRKATKYGKTGVPE